MKRSLNDNERRAFEDFLLAGSDPDKQQAALGHLVPGSQPHRYLNCINKLRTTKDLSAEDKATIEKYTRGASRSDT